MTHHQHNNTISNSAISLLAPAFLFSLLLATTSSTLARADSSSSTGIKSAIVLPSEYEQQPLNAIMEKRWSSSPQQQRFAFAKRRAFAFAKRANGYYGGDLDAAADAGSRFAFAKRAAANDVDPADFVADIADKQFAFVYGPRRFAFAKRAGAGAGDLYAYRNFAFAR